MADELTELINSSQQMCNNIDNSLNTLNHILKMYNELDKLNEFHKNALENIKKTGKSNFGELITLNKKLNG